MKDAAAPRSRAEQASLASAAVGAASTARIERDPDEALWPNVPAWPRDSLTISARVRALLEGLRPLAVRVLGFWDHARRALTLGAARLEIDPSGSYRLVR